MHDPKAPLPVQVAPPGEAVTVYDEPGSPAPLPAVTVTVACPSPATAVGAFGTGGAEVAAVGLTALEAAEADDVPALLVAVEVKVYELPFVKPVTAQEVAGTVTVQVAPPGEAVTVYEVGVSPLPGGLIVTVACPSTPATAVGVPGVPGGAAWRVTVT